jgi:hypothetical protein
MMEGGLSEGDMRPQGPASGAALWGKGGEQCKYNLLQIQGFLRNARVGMSLALVILGIGEGCL